MICHEYCQVYSNVGSTHFNVQSHVIEFVITTQKCSFKKKKKSESVFIILKQPCPVIEVDLERGEAHRNKHFSEYSLADIVHFVNCGYHHH